MATLRWLGAHLRVKQPSSHLGPRRTLATRRHPRNVCARLEHTISSRTTVLVDLGLVHEALRAVPVPRLVQPKRLHPDTGGLLPNGGTRIIDSSRLLCLDSWSCPHVHTVPGG